MSQPSWKDVPEPPDELDEETTGTLGETAAEVQDTTGEGRPYPQVDKKEATTEPDSSGLLVQETDQVPGTESVSNTVEDNADRRAWQPGNSCYRTPLCRI